MRKDCLAQKYCHNEKFEKAEKAIDGVEDDVVMCLLMSKNKKESKKKSSVHRRCEAALGDWYDVHH